MKATRKRTKFAALGAALIVVIAGILGFTGWFAYHGQQAADDSLKSANKVSSDIPKVKPVASFEDCKKAGGSKMLETYPEQCATTGGKTFTDPSQKYLVIQEWGVQFQIPSVLKSMKYTLAGTNTVELDSTDLSDLAGSTKDCGVTPGYLGSVTRTTTDPVELLDAVKIAHIGKYYYYHTGPASACIPPGAESEAAIPSGKYKSMTLQSSADQELLQVLPATFGPSK